MNKYERLYCLNCELVWPQQAFGKVAKCSDCKKELCVKSFDPWARVWAGLFLIFMSCLTLLIDSFPMIWIGGTTGGCTLIYQGIKRWRRIVKLDFK